MKSPVTLFGVVVLGLASMLQPSAAADAPIRFEQVVATVLDPTGNFAPQLRAKDFIVEENGAKLTVVGFSASSEAPLSLAIMIDSSALMSQYVSTAAGAVRPLLSLLGPRDEYALYSFDTDLHVIQPFGPIRSADLPKITIALDKLKKEGGKGQTTALYNVVSDGMAQMKYAKHGRRALVVITDAKDRDAGSIGAVKKAAQQYGVTIYSIGISGTLPPKSKAGAGLLGSGNCNTMKASNGADSISSVGGGLTDVAGGLRSNSGGGGNFGGGGGGFNNNNGGFNNGGFNNNQYNNGGFNNNNGGFNNNQYNNGPSNGAFNNSVNANFENAMNGGNCTGYPGGGFNNNAGGFNNNRGGGGFNNNRGGGGFNNNGGGGFNNNRAGGFNNNGGGYNSPFATPVQPQPVVPAGPAGFTRKSVLLDTLVNAGSGRLVQIDLSAFTEDAGDAPAADAVQRIIGLGTNISTDLRGQYTIGYYTTSQEPIEKRVTIKVTFEQYRAEFKAQMAEYEHLSAEEQKANRPPTQPPSENGYTVSLKPKAFEPLEKAVAVAAKEPAPQKEKEKSKGK